MASYIVTTKILYEGKVEKEVEEFEEDDFPKALFEFMRGTRWVDPGDKITLSYKA